MNVEYLRTFLALAENGSFSKTALERGVVQSTVSARVQELERELGRRLFTRDAGRAELTLAGRSLLRYARGIVELENGAVDGVNLAGAFAERLIIGTVYEFHKCFMTRNVMNFMSKRPDIALRVEFGHSPRIISLAREGKIDVGYSHHAFHCVGFRCELLCEDDIILVTSGENRALAGGAALDEIKNFPVFNSNFLYADTRNKIFPKHQIFRLDIDIGENIVPYIVNGVVNGGGCAFLPRGLIRRELRDGALLEIPILDDKIPTMKNYVIYKQESPKSGVVRQWMNEFSLDE